MDGLDLRRDEGMEDHCHVPFGEDHTYRDFLLHLFGEGEDAFRCEIEEEEDGAAEERAMDDLDPIRDEGIEAIPFGNDDSYRMFLLHLFEEGGGGGGGEDGVAASGEIEEEGEDSNGAEGLRDGDPVVNANVQTRPIECFDPSARPPWNKYAFVCTIAASIICLVLGYEIAVMSEGSAYIKSDLGMSDDEVDFWLAVCKLSSLVGSALAGWTSNLIGNRYKILVVGALFFIGPLLMDLLVSFFFFMVSRCIIYIGVGYALTITPVYVAEISPAFYRGLLTSLPELFINGGTLLGYISHYFFSKFRSYIGWRIVLFVGSSQLVLLALGALTMPESPRWLIMHGRLGDAKCILARISNSEEEAALRLAEIKEAVGIPEERNDDVVEVTPEGVWQDLLRLTPSVFWHMFVCTIGIYLFQQASGMDTILLYIPRILEKSGIDSANAQLLIVIGLEFMKTICVLIATFLLDRVGRRSLLLSSIGGMVFSLASLGACLFINHSHGEVNWVTVMCILSLVAYMVSFSIGMGPIPLVYSAEVLPLRLRAQGCAIGVAVSQATSGLFSLKFMLLYRAMTLGGATFLFMGFAIFAWLLFYFLLPETKGLTLEETGQLFGKWTKWRSTAEEIDIRRNATEQRRGATGGA